MDDFPPYLQQAFRRTFVEGFKDARRRTTSFEWQELLRRYFAELVECPNDTRHAHWKGASNCPYCAAEERGRALANEMRAQMGLPPLPGPKRKGRRAQRAFAVVGNGEALELWPAEAWHRVEEESTFDLNALFGDL